MDSFLLCLRWETDLEKNNIQMEDTLASPHAT